MKYQNFERPPNQISTHVHFKVPVKTKGILDRGFRQEIGVLALRLYVRDFKLSVFAGNGGVRRCASSSSW